MLVSTQVGFVAGTLALAISGLNDVVASRRILVVAGLVAAISNFVLLVADGRFDLALVSRFMVGVSLGVFYPTGMRVVATWFEHSRGMAIGVVVGALTLGSALPYLITAIGTGFDWRTTVAGASALALVASAIGLLAVREGPFQARAQGFDFGAGLKIFREPAMRLVSVAYFGHMWEVYGMWAWLPAFMAASLAQHGLDSLGLAGGVAGLAIAAGAVSSVLGGALGDRIGRTATTIGAMTISACCAVLAGLLFGAPPVVVGAIALVWGISVIADSPQFSAAITELAPADRIGSCMSLQMALGYLVSALSIQFVPVVTESQGWGVALVVLAIGPAIGVLAMMRLRARPEAFRLANGRR